MKHIISEFEQEVTSRGWIVDSIHQDESRHVRKVEGRIPFLNPYMQNGVKKYKKCYHHIRWDAYGKAFMSYNNKRMRAYDLSFDKTLNENEN